MVSRGFVFSLLIALVVGYIGLNLLVRFLYPKQLFPYRGSSYEEHAGLHWAEAADGNRIAMIFQPAADEEAPLILYFHGNGEDIGMNAERFQWINQQGFSVLAADYPGYGLSTGEPTADSVRAAAEAAARYAQKTLGVSADRTILWGRSLGGAPAIHLGTQHRYRGLILEAAFRSVLSLAPPIPLLLEEPFPNEELMKNVDAPVFIFHGGRDRIIPRSHAQSLAEAAGQNGNLILIDEGTHNDLRFVAGMEMAKALQSLREP